MDTDNLIPISLMEKGDQADDYSLGNLAVEAEEYIASQSWCKSALDGHFGLGYHGIVGVFLFEIEPTHEQVDRLLWVVTGDLPPAYLVCDDCPNPVSALKAYIMEMRRWVEAVCHKQDIGEHIINVNVPPTKEFAEMLQGRLDFLEEKTLSRPGQEPG